MTGTDTHSTLKYKGYEGTIERDDDRKIFRGKLLHLSDLVTYESDTLSVSALSRAFVEAVDDYIETCQLLDRAASPSSLYRHRHRERQVQTIVYLASHIPGCSRSTLLKSVAMLDVEHLREVGMTLTGLAYQTEPGNGLVSEELDRLLDEPSDDVAHAIKLDHSQGDDAIVIAQVPFDGAHFTRRQMRLLREVVKLHRTGCGKHT